MIVIILLVWYNDNSLSRVLVKESKRCVNGS